jgi:hypothetical protein
MEINDNALHSIMYVYHKDLADIVEQHISYEEIVMICYNAINGAQFDEGEIVQHHI